MRSIILAAGCGKRMHYSNNKPKCLLKINGKTLLERLLNQLKMSQVEDISIVVGYKKHLIIDLLKKLCIDIDIIHNNEYEKDTNIYSLVLGLNNNPGSFYLFEADCIFEDKCFDLIFNPLYKNKSVWFSKGILNINQIGGVIKANQLQKVKDLQIINQYHKRYSSYNKLIGVMKVGKNEVNLFEMLLRQYCDKSMKQYYHIPWINNLDKLESYLCDFGNLKVASINNIYQYKFAKALFNNETC